MTHRDPTQLDLFTSLEHKESGMAQARDHADHSWKDRYELTIHRLAGTGVPFTSEDVTAHVGLPTGAIRKDRNNAVGALINAAARAGVIRKTGRRVASRRPSSHGAELSEWVGVRQR
jgi:hypothetical protein